jgi:hypothetical protein
VYDPAGVSLVLREPHPFKTTTEQMETPRENTLSHFRLLRANPTKQSIPNEMAVVITGLRGQASCFIAEEPVPTGAAVSNIKLAVWFTPPVTAI